jgi:hypothetical protein
VICTRCNSECGSMIHTPDQCIAALQLALATEREMSGQFLRELEQTLKQLVDIGLQVPVKLPRDGSTDLPKPCDPSESNQIPEDVRQLAINTLNSERKRCLDIARLHISFSIGDSSPWYEFACQDIAHAIEYPGEESANFKSAAALKHVKAKLVEMVGYEADKVWMPDAQVAEFEAANDVKVRKDRFGNEWLCGMRLIRVTKDDTIEKAEERIRNDPNTPTVAPGWPT